MSIFDILGGNKRELVFIPAISFGYLYTKFGSIGAAGIPYIGDIEVGPKILLILSIYAIISSTFIYNSLRSEEFTRGIEEVTENSVNIGGIIGYTLLIQYILVAPVFHTLVITEGDIVANSLLFLILTSLISFGFDIFVSKYSSYEMKFGLLG
ncbi:hypothetical protein [Halorubrum ezzemoulense]|uniref:hypothetical protein n=1 Tax=Halorubrum ezzemoulense TaxID=337243 RepID=UPI00232E7A7F|nr:hypothetical protein [Halorubrum ezzemoulense]MDB2237580.1 hypothetical protein [Halorubrum ezzemoulense]MDB2248926.1 hypothetical protein [Halorubrum ezzemoulense]